MKNFDQDRDFLDLLAAWHENKSLSPARKKALITRLELDEDLRTELAREIEMAGLTRVAQAGEPRWLELEENLVSTIWKTRATLNLPLWMNYRNHLQKLFHSLRLPGLDWPQH